MKLELDSRFDFSDNQEEFSTISDVITEQWEDNEVLEELNILPRFIGAYFERLSKIEQEVEKRQILVKPVITLQERKDDWLAERRNEIKTEISVLSKQQDALKEERDLIDQEFERRFKERGTSGTRAGRFTISMKEDDHYPEVYDRNEFESYILQTGKIHLLQKRLSMSAIQEELAALQEEYEVHSARLEKSSNKEQTALDIYYELFGGNEGLDNKLTILKQTGTLVETCKQELEDYFNVPGIRITTKRTINSVKRG